MAAGQFGAPVSSITISARTALAILRAQEASPGRWPELVPLWALALGAGLEVINPGHLQSAMQGDYARACVVQRLIGGELGTRN